VTIRRHSAITSSSRRLGAVALLAACALLGSLLLAATASAAPSGRGHLQGTWTDTSTHSGAVVSGEGTESAADPAATASVIGGHNTTVAKYPSLAYIEGVQATDGYACTGTVVAPRVVLTAGHCVEDVESGSLVEPTRIGVATGVSNLQKIAKANISRVERVLVNPNFNPSKLRGDAGLLILSSPVTATPIRLASTTTDAPLYEAGTELQIAGWGLDELGKEHRPNQLQTGTVPIQSSSRCKAGLRFFYPFFDPSIQLCTLDTHHHVIFCHGDSGGPGMTTGADGMPVEIGVISLNDGVCNPHDPAVYTRVDQIQPWVQKWIEHVEDGGPEPKVRIPKAHLPTLTRERAEELSYILMLEKFKGRFKNGHEQTIHCSRQGKAKLKCDVTWWQGANDYFGSINVFYAIRHNVVLVNAHYSINWVNDRCYFHSDHPSSCKVNTLSH
jgi:hypothetical protein